MGTGLENDLGGQPGRPPDLQDAGHDPGLPVCSTVSEAAVTRLALTEDSRPRARTASGIPAPGVGRRARQRDAIPQGGGTASQRCGPHERECARPRYLCPGSM